MLEKGPLTILLGGQELIQYIDEQAEINPKSGYKYITNCIVCLWCGVFNLILGINIKSYSSRIQKRHTPNLCPVISRPKRNQIGQLRTVLNSLESDESKTVLSCPI